MQIEIKRNTTPDKKNWIVIDKINAKNYEVETYKDAEGKQLELCIENEICTECLGTGEVEIMTAPDDSITRRCHCSVRDEDDYNEEE